MQGKYLEKDILWTKFKKQAGHIVTALKKTLYDLRNIPRLPYTCLSDQRLDIPSTQLRFES